MKLRKIIAGIAAMCIVAASCAVWSVSASAAIEWQTVTESWGDYYKATLGSVEYEGDIDTVTITGTVPKRNEWSGFDYFDSKGQVIFSCGTQSYPAMVGASATNWGPCEWEIFEGNGVTFDSDTGAYSVTFSSLGIEAGGSGKVTANFALDYVTSTDFAVTSVKINNDDVTSTVLGGSSPAVSELDAYLISGAPENEVQIDLLAYCQAKKYDITKVCGVELTLAKAWSGNFVYAATDKNGYWGDAEWANSSYTLSHKGSEPLCDEGITVAMIKLQHADNTDNAEPISLTLYDANGDVLSPSEDSGNNNPDPAPAYSSTSSFAYVYTDDLSYFWQAMTPHKFLTQNTDGAQFVITYDHTAEDDASILLIAKDPEQGWWAAYEYTNLGVGTDLTLTLSVEDFLALTNVKNPGQVQDIIIRDGWWPQTVSVKSVQYVAGTSADTGENTPSGLFFPIPAGCKSSSTDSGVGGSVEAVSEPELEIVKVGFTDKTSDSDKSANVSRVILDDTSIFDNPAAKLHVIYNDKNEGWEDLCIGVSSSNGDWHQAQYSTSSKPDSVLEITIATLLSKLGIKAEDAAEIQIMGFNGCSVSDIELAIPEISTLEPGVVDLESLDISDDISRRQLSDTDVLSGTGILRVYYTAPSDGQLMFGFVLDEAHNWAWKQVLFDVKAGSGRYDVNIPSLIREAGVDPKDVFSMQVAGINGVVVNRFELFDPSLIAEDIGAENVLIDEPDGAYLNGDYKELANALLSDEDILRVAAGEKLMITFSCEDASGSLEKADKEAVEAEADGDEIVYWFNASIKTQVGNDKEKTVEWTNKPVDMTVELDDDAVFDDADYYVIRLHDGETTRLDAQLDGNDLRFENDGFSLFAVAYSAASSLDDISIDEEEDDTVLPEISTNTDDESEDSNVIAAPGGTDVQPEAESEKPAVISSDDSEVNPHTGVTVGSIAAMVIAGLTAVFAKKKKD